MTEDQLEQEALGWLGELGYQHLYGPDIAHDGDNPERESYREVVLAMRLRAAVARAVAAADAAVDVVLVEALAADEQRGALVAEPMAAGSQDGIDFAIEAHGARR